MKIIKILILCMPGIFSSQAAEKSGFIKPKYEAYTLLYRNVAENKTCEWKWTIFDTTYNRQQVTIFKSFDDNLHSILLFQKKDCTPLLFQQYDKTSRLVEEIEYSNNKARITIPNRSINKHLSIKRNTFNLISFPILFRTQLITSGRESLSFSRIVDARNWGFIVIDFEAKIIGEETVKTATGSYDCYKIELKVSGPIGRFFWRKKYYYYFTKQLPWFFVKYFSQGEESIETLRYEYH